MDNIAFLVSKTSAVQLWLLGSKPKTYSDIVGMFDIYLYFFVNPFCKTSFFGIIGEDIIFQAF